MVHSFDDKLDPDTEYMIIVFGYDGGLTTPLFTEKFRTLKPNDPTDVTFEITYGNLTARSASVTFKPSDASVAYFSYTKMDAGTVIIPAPFKVYINSFLHFHLT